MYSNKIASFVGCVYPVKLKKSESKSQRMAGFYDKADCCVYPVKLKKSESKSQPTGKYIMRTVRLCISRKVKKI